MAPALLTTWLLEATLQLLQSTPYSSTATSVRALRLLQSGCTATSVCIVRLLQSMYHGYFSPRTITFQSVLRLLQSVLRLLQSVLRLLQSVLRLFQSVPMANSVRWVQLPRKVMQFRANLSEKTQLLPSETALYIYAILYKYPAPSAHRPTSL